MYRTATQTACLLAALLNRSGQSRARLSTKTIRIVANRANLRSAFMLDVSAALAIGHDWILFELGGGGYGAIHAPALEAAKPVTAKRWFTDEERKALKRGTADLTSFEEEVARDLDTPDYED